ncbi:asparagine synthase C-terminal domain-containing protein [Saliphagus infecundisoli]|uniref:Asparagine synthase C-terminal domain-containing protein n=1 Tax=Saliphagus infecundisoli TaxID=1849069 RepID=A0ABD5QK71_9EURY|nr:asparagine synthase-related protein [Saliphagus infecundisoli]
MTAGGPTELRGGVLPRIPGPDSVREALDRTDPLPGTGGFAGSFDGRLVRDVLGRRPLYTDGEDWAFSPADLDDPTLFPAGTIDDDGGREQVWELPVPDPESDHDPALEAVDRALAESVADVPAEGTAVAFSGGVDSALLAAFLDVPLYVAGFPGSHDIEAARSAAAAMGREGELTVVELTHGAVERALPKLVPAIDRANAMDLGIALPLYLTAERAREEGHDRLALGQGADELFGGYEKVATLDGRVEATTVRGAVREQVLGLPDELPRDVLAVEAAGVRPVAPYLHDRVIGAALRLPPELLVEGGGDGRRKIAFRRVASRYLPGEVADRPKKALQYGSDADRELDRIARRAGYKRRIGNHVEAFVRARLRDDGATEADE